MDVDLLRPDEISREDRSAWDHSVSRSRHLWSPMASVEWALLLARHRPTTRLLRMSADDGSLSFLGMDVAAGRARSLGVGLTDRQAVIGPPGNRLDVRSGLRRAGLRSGHFDQLTGDEEPFGPFVVRHRSSPVIDLSAGMDVHLARLGQHGSRVEAWLRRKTSLLEREMGAINVVHGSIDSSDLAALIDAKSTQYQRTGSHDAFSEPWVCGVAREVMTARSENLTGVLSVLYAGDRPVAHHLGVMSSHVVHWWLPSYDVGASRYSPGLLLLVDLARFAAERGVAELDLGSGDEDYKRRVMSGSYPLFEARVDATAFGRQRQRARTRVAALRRPS